MEQLFVNDDRKWVVVDGDIAETGIREKSTHMCNDFQRDREMLVIACLVLIASILLDVNADGNVFPQIFPSVILPPLCLTRELFGISCPGCGLTRSFIHLAHFHWNASWEAHSLGWVLFVTMLLQIPYRIHCMVTRKNCISPILTKWFGRTLIFLLIANWCVNVCV